jgi:hypothetical protein
MLGLDVFFIVTVLELEDFFIFGFDGEGYNVEVVFEGKD